jgi:hypothetical protein
MEVQLTRRPTRRTVIGAGLALAGAAGVLALALTGAGAALAQDPTPSPSTSASASATAPSQDNRDAARAQRDDQFAEALAKELGIDKAKVADALTKVRAAREAEAKAQHIADLKTRLDTAVTAGKLTREQADAILKAAEAGVLPVGGPGGGPGHRGPGR